jgi:hypothetical protein
MTDSINDCRVKKESRQEEQEFVETVLKVLGIESQAEACNDRRDRRNDIMYDDQPLARRQLQYWMHEIAATALPESLSQ